MGIEIPDLFPKKKSEVSVTEDSPQESSRPIPPESGVQNLEQPSPVSVDIQETDSNARKESNQSGEFYNPGTKITDEDYQEEARGIRKMKMKKKGN
ncbi:hypothetical protein HOLleu_02398 [Holothuria leucospilota]|uniref:Uncharacterized protein n=1 Tax=Holothuria leucospilota TaxID=206669 RepID=A0A9Q1CQM5_HOLLE|nr:hypothetical protein HOLleu_02398 [Holothuria leucospilota]